MSKCTPEICVGAPHQPDCWFLNAEEKAPNLKETKNKPAWEELPLGALGIVAAVMGYGARKYAPGNWANERAAAVPQYCAAAMRHMARVQAGEIMDESGLPHLAHAVASLLIALHHQTQEPGAPWR